MEWVAGGGVAEHAEHPDDVLALRERGALRVRQPAVHFRKLAEGGALELLDLWAVRTGAPV